MKKDKKIEKLLEDILRIEPELKSDSKKLEETLKILSNLNPDIKISKKFKEKLKLKIDNIIGLKKNYIETKPKHNYFQILITVLSGAFAMFGFFYFLGDGMFYTGDKGQKVLQEIRFSGESDDMMIRYETIIDSRLENKLNNRLNNKLKTKNPESEVLDVPQENYNSKKIENTKGSVTAEPRQVISKPVVKQADDTTTKDKTILRTNDNLIDDFIGEENISEENILDTDFDIGDLGGLEDDKVYGDDINEIESNGETSNLGVQDGNTDYGFIDYCNSIGGVFKEETNLCTLNDKSCTKKDYDTGKCPKLLDIERDTNISIEDFINEFSQDK